MTSEDLRNVVRETEKIMEKGGSRYLYFKEYCRFYFQTNEDIKLGLENLEFDKERTLTVMGSGDQVFNLSYLGAKMIDAFDVNQLSYFIYHLRKAIFLAYGYEKSHMIEGLFLFCDTDPKKLLDILYTLKSFMRDDVYLYFEEILKYNCYLSSEFQKNHFCCLCRPDSGGGANLYDNSKTDFNRLQDNLERTSVNFVKSDIRDLPDVLQGEYGFMYLSNVIQQFILSDKDMKFIDLILRFNPYLKPNGVIVNYIFGNYDLNVFKQGESYLKDMGFKGNMRIRTKYSDHVVIMRKRAA